jgi:aspartyl-tRNA(Asn)/glutamyl-tRNA(Gln) amidotransferase subunit A
MSDLHDKSVAELSAALQARQVSSVEVTRTLLDRVERHQANLNAFISITAEAALAEAARADVRLGRKDAGPLTGIPIAHKDIFCTQGEKTTCGSRMLAEFVSPYDATVVERLRAAGVVMLGKTNMDEFAMGSSNETSFFGPVRNPWDVTRVPGGSSGGSAVAVAARLTPAATATDTGGSIRQPAALCGVTGFKPTYGRVSRFGMIAFASSLDQGGLITRSAEDAALLLGVMAGFDERDSTSVELPVPDYAAALGQPLKGLKIGVLKEFFDTGLDGDIEQHIRAALELLRAQGAVVKDVSLPNLPLSVPTYYVVAPAECSSNLARFDGVRYGYRSPHSDTLSAMYSHSRDEGFGAEVKRRILLGTYALSAGYYDAYYLKAQQVRRLLAEEFLRAFAEVDAIVTPTSPVPAFKLGEKTDDPVSMYLADIYTVTASLAGICGVTVPCGKTKAGLPVGMQVLARHFGESTAFRVARAAEAAKI